LCSSPGRSGRARGFAVGRLGIGECAARLLDGAQTGVGLGEVREFGRCLSVGALRGGPVADGAGFVAAVEPVDSGKLGGRNRTRIRRSVVGPRTVLLAVPLVRHGLAATKQLDVVRAEAARAHEEMTRQQDAVEGHADAFADGEVERAEAEAGSAPVVDHRGQLEEARGRALDLALESEFAENHGIDVVRHVGVGAAVALLHAQGNLLQTSPRDCDGIGIGAEFGCNSEERADDWPGRALGRAACAPSRGCREHRAHKPRPRRHCFPTGCQPSAWS